MFRTPPACYSPLLKIHLKNLGELSLKFERNLMLLKQDFSKSFEELVNAFMAAQVANLELYRQESQRLTAAYVESKDVLLHAYSRDKQLLMDTFYARVKKGRKDRKEAKKYRKAIALGPNFIYSQGSYYELDLEKEKIEYTIIELLGFPTELLTNHYKKYWVIYDIDDEA